MRRVAAGLLAFFALCSCQLAFSTVGSWTTEAGPPRPITTNNVVALADGRVAIFGGLSLQTGQESGQTVIYDPATRSWTTKAPMPGPPSPDVVVRLRDGTVLVEGGEGNDNAPSGATRLYDPALDSWSQAGSVIEPRSGPAYALLSDGRLLIAGGGLPLAQPIQLPGGTVSNFRALTSAEIFDPHTGTWSLAGNLQSARFGVRLVALGNGRALAAGGCQGSAGFTPPMAAAEVFDPATSTWRSTTPLPIPVCAATGVALRDGRALIVDQYMFNSSSDAFLYDPKSAKWSNAGGLAGGGSAAVMLTDGRVFVPEVQPGVPQGHVFIDSVGGQIFDPSTNQWTFATTTQVPLPLVYLYAGGTQIAAALPDGTALVILQTAALAFHPNDAAPATGILDSTGLTFVLGAAALVIVLLLALAYHCAARTDPAKLA